MEIKILVQLNERAELKKFIETCKEHGMELTREGGGKLPSFSGYYAQLKGVRWDKNKIMTKEKEFIKELTALMEKYEVEMYIDIDQDYAGVQGAELRFNTKDICSSLVFSGWDRNVDADMVRAEANEA